MVDAATRVLVVDDVATMRKILSGLLNRIGFQNVEAVETPSQALRLLEQQEFGLVISDWHMDEMSGLQLLGKIRDTPAFWDIPVILISAEDSEDNIAAARAGGASCYLVKPFGADVLKSKVTEALELRATGQTTYSGCTLMPRGDATGYRCHILKDGEAIAASTLHATRQGAIEEAKLWVDQLGGEK